MLKNNRVFLWFTSFFCTLLLASGGLNADAYNGQMQASSGSVERFYRQVSYLEGLPSPTIYSLHVTPAGLMYVGTELGIFRFNGFRFERLSMPEARHQPIDTIMEDERGRIWCKNFANQIFFIDGDQLQAPAGLNAFFREREELVAMFTQGPYLYLETFQNIYRYSLETEEIETLLPAENPGVVGMYVTENQEILFRGVDGHLHRVGQPKPLREATFRNFSDGRTHFISREGRTLLLNRGSQKNFKLLESDQVVPLEVGEGALYKYFWRSLDGEDLWVCTNRGAFRLNPSSLQIEETLLPELRVSDMVRDRHGNIWVGTLDEGLFMFPALPVQVTRPLPEGQKKPVSYTALHRLPSGNLLVGTNTGAIIELDAKGNLLRVLLEDGPREIEFIYFAAEQQRILHTNGYVAYADPSRQLQAYFGKDMVQDDFGNLVVASYGLGGVLDAGMSGIPKLPFQRHYPFEKFNQADIQVMQLASGRMRRVFYGSKQGVYGFSSTNGLYLIDATGERQLLRGPMQEDHPAFIVDAITASADGDWWLATQKNGLFRLSFSAADSPALQLLAGSENLNGLNHVQWDAAEEYLYFNAESKIYRYHLASGTFTLLPISMYLKGITIRQFLLTEEELIIATNAGLFFQPLEVEPPEMSISLAVTGLLVDGQPHALDAPIPYGHQQVQVLYQVLDFVNFNERQLFYGFQADTLENTADAGASLLNLGRLHAGDRTLQLYAQNDVMRSDRVILPLTVAFPWWQQWPYLTVVFILLVLGIRFGYHQLRRRIERREQVKELLVSSQLSGLRAQLNPHFFFNALNTMQGLIYAEDQTAASTYLGKFSALMRRFLSDNDKQYNLLEYELETVRLFVDLESMRMVDELEFSLQVSDKIQPEHCMIPSMMLQPFIENAIRFGLVEKEGLKTLSVEVRPSDRGRSDELTVEIRDNGIGREASKTLWKQRKYRSPHVSNEEIETRIALIGQLYGRSMQVHIQDLGSPDAPLGTAVLITLPTYAK
ncbi:MAG: histidine kinase [Nitritalea sp.]